MTAPERKRPTKANSPIQLEPEVEDYGVLSAIAPAEPQEPEGEKRSQEPREPAEPVGSREPTETREPHPNWAQLLGQEPYLEKQKRSVTLPVEQIRRAQIAQKASDHLGGEYQTFSDLVSGAIERELHRLSVLYNNGQPWAEYQGTYRTGRVQDSIR